MRMVAQTFAVIHRLFTLMHNFFLFLWGELKEVLYTSDDLSYSMRDRLLRLSNPAE